MFNVKFLPNNVNVGTFSPFDQIIRLDGFSQKDVREVLSGDSLSKWKNAFHLFRTIFHEYTHFLDMTTTTYGLSVLSDIFAASGAYSNNKNSATDIGANKARNTLSEINKDEKHAQILNSFNKPWGYRDWYAYAKSHEEDETHVLTGTIFFNPENKVEIARAPFSIPSLLESNAIANELFFSYIYSQSKIPTTADKDILQKKVTLEMLNLIYDKDFCLYSVCLHRCANILNQIDIIDACNVSSLICEICFDVSPYTLSQIAPPPETLNFVETQLRTRMIEEIKNGSRPLLFFMLTSLLANPESGIEDLPKLRAELEKKAGLTNLSDDAASVKDGLFKILSKRKNSNPQYKNLLAIIEKNLLVKKKVPFYSFHDYELPNVLLGDGTTFNINSHYHPNQIGSSFNPSIHAEWMSGFQNWL